jgi:aldehyde dehydrogenase (NAD+)
MIRPIRPIRPIRLIPPEAAGRPNAPLHREPPAATIEVEDGHFASQFTRVAAMSTVVADKIRPSIAASSVVAQLRATYELGQTRPIKERRRQLDGIIRFLKERESAIEAALKSDLGRPSIEVYPTEIAFVASEAALARKKLKSWSKPARVPTALVGQPGRSWIYHEPFGVVLVIGPWNYPVQLVLGPLVGAIAAGNCAVIKPSEVAPATSDLLARHLPHYVSPDWVRVVEGGIPETTDLLAQRFDYIFYTGNCSVGRIVMEAAAKNLTPVTLELGGKSPCIVDQYADLVVAARRIIWGKFFNAGQTCVAPDYVLAHEAIADELIAQFQQTVVDFFGEDPRKSPDFGRIVNARHHRRLMKLLAGSGEPVAGGSGDEHDRYLAPTILRDVTAESPVMSDEIFGPILPVLKIRDITQAIAFVNARPKPLALYLFSQDQHTQNRVIEQTSSGGVTINHTLLHVAIPSLPFGGVGASGLGAYHGRASFETFSHRKSVLKKPTWFDPWFFYPPYNASKRKWMRRLI